MNIQESIEILKELKKNEWGELENCSAYAIQAIEILLTAYEKEKEERKRIGKLYYEANENCIKYEKELEKEKEKNEKIYNFCRRELAFERRLKREKRKPDEFNQGRFYVSENIRKIIREE